MAIEFTNKPIKWTNEGTAPSEDLKTNGFQAGYKPPAAVFNNQWHTTGECIDELQTKLSGVDDKKVDKVTGKSLIDENVAEKVSYDSESGNVIVVGDGVMSTGLKISQGNGGIVLNPYGMKLNDTGAPSFEVSASGICCHNLEADVCIGGNRVNAKHKLSEKANSSDVLEKTNTEEFTPTADYQPATKKYVDDNKTPVVDNLTSTSATSALSANQGKVLDDKITDLPIKSLAGQSVQPTSDTTVTAKTCATIIGDLRDRTFDSNIGNATAGNVASGEYSTAIGCHSTASGNYSTAIGLNATASEYGSTAMGRGTTASGSQSFAGGMSTTAVGESSTAFGFASRAGGKYSTAIGYYSKANGDYSTDMGVVNNALKCQFKCGHYAKSGTEGNIDSTDGDAFIIGNGTSASSTSNCFRVTYAGTVYGLATFKTSGADYAEYFEWKDGNPNNEDRRGRLVTLDGEKIRLATVDDDYILGVVSANPCIEGDVYSDDWQGKYLTDVFGQRLTQTVHIPARYEEQEVTDPETGETTTENVLVEEEHEAVQWVLNPDYDPEQEYVSREDRKEWSAIGLMGKLVVIDDGTCEVNGCCNAGVNGIATKANDGYRVMARIDDTHIRVLVR